ncbi:MAG: FtsX-like permease family protein [Opitutales bacterium]|nr:FtsX-like permease family protein [Opitutales bacterium]
MDIRSRLQLVWLLLTRMTFRHWRSKMGHYLLLLGIVAVGVGAFNGIRQASRSASANFGLFNQAVSGQSDFLIESPVQRIQEADLVKLFTLSTSPDWHLVPVIEGSVTAVECKGVDRKQLRLIGLDLLALGNLPTLAQEALKFSDEDDANWYDWLGSTNDVWVGQKLADVLKVDVGDEISFLASGHLAKMRVRMILNDPDGNLPDDLVLADLPTVQSLLSRPGELNRVEVVIDKVDRREDSAYLAEIENRLLENMPANLTLSPTQNRAADRAAMTAAFRLNLTILSLIAILVGAYLILQALDAAVVRRRSEIATLRSLGVDGSVLFTTYLLEAFVLGVVGSIAGVGVGQVLALGAVGMLADTVNALYFATSVEALNLTALDVGVGMVLGLIFSMLAGWLPARDATQTPPAQVLARGDWSPGFSWLRKPKVGLGLLVLGGICLLFPPFVMEAGSNMPVGGFLAAGCWILGSALLSGHVLVLLAGWVRPFCTGPVARLACSRLQDGSSRHRLAVAGLVVAVSMVTGMFQMIDSFRGTIEEWFDVRFQADLYISESGVTGAGSANGIDPKLMDEILKDPNIKYADVMRICYAKPSKGVTVLAGVDMKHWSNQARQIWLKAPGSLKVEGGAEPALISETFARRFGVLDGGVVELETPTGLQRVSPFGIFCDYGNEFGMAAISSDVWTKWTGSERPINVSLFLKDLSKLNETRDKLRIEYPGLDVRNERELRDVALGIFEQTFQATNALSFIGLAVAFAGLLLGLLSIFDESTQTWQTLKHLGFSNPRFIWAAGLEGAGIGVAAWVAGAMTGLALGWLLVFVINVQSFGWTLLWTVPMENILWFGVLLTAVGLVSGIVSASYWNFRRR